ncbi:hypothetical protein [Proteus columbae]|uniref:hypothetical protein n=1 Tax=Proteus columbae TaxID=1987580 RepID=UPI000C1E7C2F|nr:hypothetical protein [Proteus columbae]
MGINEVNLAVTTYVNNIENKIEVEYKKTLSYINDLESIINTNLNFRVGENKKTASGSNISKYIEGYQNKLKNNSDSYPVLNNKSDSYNENKNKTISDDKFNQEIDDIINNNLENMMNDLFDENDHLRSHKDFIETDNSYKNTESIEKQSITTEESNHENTESIEKQSITTEKSNNENTESIDKQVIEKKENKLPDWITNSGRKKLNVNQNLYFKREKKRSFKNLIKIFFSPFKFINRTLLPVSIDFKNPNINRSLKTFRFDSVSNNEAFSNFSNKLNQLNKTFTDNISKVIDKKLFNNKNIDVTIKYHTLEKALECKLVNDMKILSNEFKSDLAKNKFEENYSDLHVKIVNKLNDITDPEMDNLFSSNTIKELKNLLKEKVNSKNSNIKFDETIDKIVDSVLNEKNKIAMGKDFYGVYEHIKEGISDKLTKELFNKISKNEIFIGDKDSIAKVDDLIKTVSEHIHKNLGKPTEKIINLLSKSFYENIKPNDNGKDLLTRLFKNSSNNINYKWAQDAVILLISYETFENEVSELSEENEESELSKENKEYLISYDNNGMRVNGGNGYDKTQETMAKTKLKDIFNRLGLKDGDFVKYKDEVLRKYFANYFEHI